MEGTDLMDTETPRCTATSKQSGERCKRRPSPGCNVCSIHGAKAPQTQAAARLRLLAGADPAAARLVRALDDESPQVAVRAATSILDRVPGLGKVSGVEVTGTVSVQAEQIVSVIIGTLSDLGHSVDDDEVRAVAALHMRRAAARHLAPVPDAPEIGAGPDAG